MNIRFKQAISALLCVGTMLTVTSCAETPTEDIVVNKGNSNLQDKIDNSEGSSLNIETDSDGTRHETATFTSDNGVVTYNIDAEVILPDVDKFPVLKVAPHFFTSEELEKMSRVICGDNEIYEYSEEMTKSELEKIMLGYKKKISDKDALLERYGDEEAVERITEKYNEWIAQVEADYENASDEITHKLSDFEYHPDSYYTVGEGRKYIVGSAAAEGVFGFKATSNVNGFPMLIWATERHNPFHMSGIMIYPFDFRDVKDEFEYSQTEPISDKDIEEAITLVRNTFDEMDLTNMNICSYEIGEYEGNDATHYNIFFKCMPEYGGIELARDQQWFTLSSDESYSPTYNNTYLWITVSNGRIMCFEYESPLEIVETINENVEIMSYDDALKRVYDQLKLSWTGDRIGDILLFKDENNNPKATAAHVDVTDITLSMVRTKIEDDPDNFYLLPAWVVYGLYEVDEYELNGQIHDREMTYYEEPVPEPLMVINAIDGSVIDMSQGY